jgi:cyclophilin family peptidyl-prolyl cis-trans isomerase
MKLLLHVATVAALCAAGTAAAQEKKPVVVIDTSFGKIYVELFVDKAPITVKNFLRYADDKFYDGTIFHRVIADFMIQGGGMEPGLKRKQARAAIKNESNNGLSNERGTIAMARLPEPDTATSQFFINVKDNRRFDASQDMPGYAVFGKVVDGMDVVDKIRAVETEERFVGDDRRGDVPKQDVMIRSVRRKQ